MDDRADPPGWEWMSEYLRTHTGADYIEALVAWRNAGKPKKVTGE